VREVDAGCLAVYCFPSGFDELTVELFGPIFRYRGAILLALGIFAGVDGSIILTASDAPAAGACASACGVRVEINERRRSIDRDKRQTYVGTFIEGLSSLFG
jgi:hypothetical protein